ERLTGVLGLDEHAGGQPGVRAQVRLDRLTKCLCQHGRILARVDDYDVLVVGSGFGGSVAALRLTEKGYRVGVLEAGRRFGPDDLPATSWQLRDYFWMPRLGMRGIQRITLLDDALILSGAGVGGGSLVY